MVAKTATRGLSPTDLNAIRSTLDAGRKPKVVFTEAAGQIAGQVGQVVKLMDPPVDEWVVVRFGRDELPFSPTDLAIPPKTPAKPRSAKTAVAEAAPEPEPTFTEPPYEQITPVPPPRQEAVMPETSTVETPEPAAEVKPRRAARTPKVKPPADADRDAVLHRRRLAGRRPAGLEVAGQTLCDQGR